MTPQARQWYIARDDQQYGRVSDTELEKLTELGRLQPTDLLWRQGFPDWRSAFVLFPTRNLVVQKAAIDEQVHSREVSAADHAGDVAAKPVTAWGPALIAVLCALAILAVYMNYASLTAFILSP